MALVLIVPEARTIQQKLAVHFDSVPPTETTGWMKLPTRKADFNIASNCSDVEY